MQTLFDGMAEDFSGKTEKMINRDFFPTPVEIIRKMLKGISVNERMVLDPSSGKGDILKVCYRRGAKTYGCEINDDLYLVSSQYGKMIGKDFLELSGIDVSHIDFIIMNPPFSKDMEHILHAWEIAPAGCEIRALCNADTLNNSFQIVERLKSLIEEEDDLEYLGQCFTNAERTTNVNVALIKLRKPAATEEDFSEYFETNFVEEEHDYGVMKSDAIVEIVGRYVGALRMFKGVSEMSSKINEMMSPINKFSINFGCTKVNRDSRRTEHLGYNDFKIELQKSAWSTVFSKMKMDKYMTESLKEKINKFVEQQSDVPFTVQNIYNMLQFVFDGHEGRMNEVLIEVFERLTKHYHDNRHHVEGWKTNSHFMINEKIIVPYVTEVNGRGEMGISYRGNGNILDDLVKALCYLTGENYDDYDTLEGWCDHTKITDPEWYRNSEKIRHKAEQSWNYYSTNWQYKDKTNSTWTKETWIEKEIERAIERKEEYVNREFGKWHDWGFFEVKGFKKGTMHFKFKDRKVWELFNRKVAEAKGFELPENI